MIEEELRNYTNEFTRIVYNKKINKVILNKNSIITYKNIIKERFIWKLCKKSNIIRNKFTVKYNSHEYHYSQI